MRLKIGDILEHDNAGVSERFIVNRLTVTKGRLQVDAIEVDEARRRVRDLASLLELAGLEP
jgi:hypothetical protein